MSFTCGFFNSKQGDRKYNSRQISQIFDGIITDGVFAHYGTHFNISPINGSNDILIGTGRLWFNHVWGLNDGNTTLTLDPSDPTQNRIDAIIVHIDESDDVRNAWLQVKKGTVGGSKPTMTHTDFVHEYPFAYVTVAAGSGSITASGIEVVVGTSECPFVTSVLESVNVDNLFDQWDAQFKEWFAEIKTVLDEDIATKLVNDVAELQATKADKSEIPSDITSLARKNDVIMSFNNLNSGTMLNLGKLNYSNNPDLLSVPADVVTLGTNKATMLNNYNNSNTSSYSYLTPIIPKVHRIYGMYAILPNGNIVIAEFFINNTSIGFVEFLENGTFYSTSIGLTFNIGYVFKMVVYKNRLIVIATNYGGNYNLYFNSFELDADGYVKPSGSHVVGVIISPFNNMSSIINDISYCITNNRLIFCLNGDKKVMTFSTQDGLTINSAYNIVFADNRTLNDLRYINMFYYKDYVYVIGIGDIANAGNYYHVGLYISKYDTDMHLIKGIAEFYNSNSIDIGDCVLATIYSDTDRIVLYTTLKNVKSAVLGIDISGNNLKTILVNTQLSYVPYRRLCISNGKIYMFNQYLGTTLINSHTCRNILYDYMVVDESLNISSHRIDEKYTISNIQSGNEIYSYIGPYSFFPDDVYSFGNVILLVNDNKYVLFNPRTKTVRYPTTVIPNNLYNNYKDYLKVIDDGMLNNVINRINVNNYPLIYYMKDSNTHIAYVFANICTNYGIVDHIDHGYLKLTD